MCNHFWERGEVYHSIVPSSTHLARLLVLRISLCSFPSLSPHLCIGLSQNHQSSPVPAKVKKYGRFTCSNSSVAFSISLASSAFLTKVSSSTAIFALISATVSLCFVSSIPARMSLLATMTAYARLHEVFMPASTSAWSGAVACDAQQWIKPQT